MTTPETPVPADAVKPSSAKAWVATIGGLIGAAIPILGQLAGWLPEPYGAVLSGIIAIVAALTGGGTYAAKYKPTGTVLVDAGTPLPPAGGYSNPYRNE